MARKYRFEFEGSVHHVYVRGNERKPIFRSDEDRRFFLGLLDTAVEKFRWSCLSYVLMPNHFHLTIKNHARKLSKGMHWLNFMYAQHFNDKYERVGHLFQGRFGDTLVQNGRHSDIVCRYIALNPVRKKYVADPADWTWGSHAALIGKVPPRSCLDLEEALHGFGGNNRVGRQNYLEFVEGGLEQQVERGFYEPIFGDRTFIHKMIGDNADKKLSKLLRPKLREIIYIATNRSQDSLKQRNSSILKAINDWGYSGREVAEYLNMNRKSLYKILKKF